jgi:gluconate 2-dehydrogenase gamma chain
MDRHGKSSNDDRPIRERSRAGVSRRTFLKGSGAAVAAAGVVAVGGAADPATLDAFEAGVTNPPAGTTHDPTPPPPDILPGGMLRYFTPDEAQELDALVSRILPRDASDPGAHEAGVVWMIDADLASNGGINQPLYVEPPFAKFFEGDTPPNPGQYQTLFVPKAQKDRYGPQSSTTPAEQYRAGLGALNAYAKSKFAGKKYVELSPQEQDAIVDDLAGTSGAGAKDIKSTKTLGGGEVVGSYKSPADDFFSDPSAYSFFQLVRDGTVSGMFADPAYGGNRDLAGWKLIKYPGAQRAYTAEDVRTDGTGLRRAPQSLAQLSPFHPGEDVNGNQLLPVSGDQIHQHTSP